MWFSDKLPWVKSLVPKLTKSMILEGLLCADPVLLLGPGGGAQSLRSSSSGAGKVFVHRPPLGNLRSTARRAPPQPHSSYRMEGSSPGGDRTELLVSLALL